MNCSPTIAIALLLLALSAGMFLFYKTQKESLGMLFKIVSWFIIVIAIGSLVCCSVRCVFMGCNKGDSCSSTTSCDARSEGCEFGESDCGGRDGKRFKKRMMIFKEDENGCERKGEGCCEEKAECDAEIDKSENGEKKCCADKEVKVEKRIIKKDTVVIKKNS